jgi:uncharacterized protein (DUF488 family)
MTQSRAIFTIGHSNHKLERFLDLLARHGVTAIADVRSQPFSRISHFNRDAIAAALKTMHIKYVPLGSELGARRDEIECYVAGQAIYERIAQLPRFRDGIERLVKWANEESIALMCAEKEPLECHRAILVCRHLRDCGLGIRHILADGLIEEHEQTERRMMSLTNVQPDIFQPDAKENLLIEQAYEVLGKKIAYRARQEGSAE